MLSLLVLLVGVPSALSCTRITSDAPFVAWSGCYIVNIARPGVFTIAARGLQELSIEHVHKDATVNFSDLSAVTNSVRLSNIAGAVTFPLLKSAQVLSVTDSSAVSMPKLDYVTNGVTLSNIAGTASFALLRSAQLLTVTNCHTVTMPKLDYVTNGVTLSNIAGTASFALLRSAQVVTITDCRTVTMPMMESVTNSLTISGVVGRIDIGIRSVQVLRVKAVTSGVARPGVFFPRLQTVTLSLSVIGGAGDAYVRVGRKHGGS
jgi:hypothetical protein